MDSRFVGAWTAVSWELRPTDGGESYYPLGKDAQGLLIYSADGYMSVSLMRPGRVPFETPWLLEGTPAEKVAAMESYTAYAGRYEVRESERKVVHHVEFSLFPNWIGTAQERLYRFEEDRLVLYTEPFASPDGNQQAAFLVWKKLGMTP